MGGEDQHLGYLHVLGGVGGIDGHVGDIVARQGLDAFVDVGGALGVAVEAGVAEVGLHQSWFKVGNADSCVCDIKAQTVGDGLHSSLGSAVDIAVGVGSVAGYRADVDDMAAVALHHTRNNQTGHRQQPLDVGVDHGVPIVVAALILGFEAKSKAGVVYKHVDVFPLGRKVVDALRCLVAVADIEEKSKHVGTIGSKFVADFLKTLSVATCENKAVAVGGEFSCATQADTACCACYHYYLVHQNCIYIMKSNGG